LDLFASLLGGLGLPRAELLSANAAVERALLDRAVALDARLALLAGLRETRGEFGDTVEAEDVPCSAR
jgi:hypothetical protein